jgi:hypothetical protein
MIASARKSFNLKSSLMLTLSNPLASPTFVEALQKLHQVPLTKLSSSYSSISSYLQTLNRNDSSSYQLILSH